MIYHRTIRFADTDAAGVVYFATLLSICHEAYEDAIARTSIDLASFFSGNFRDKPGNKSGNTTTENTSKSAAPIAIPIAHAEIDFRHPLHCGDEIAIAIDWQPHLPPDPNRDTTREPSEFTIAYTVYLADRTAARAQTRHVCIDRQTRQRRPIPAALRRCFDGEKQPETLE